jgi:glyoxylase-like metal-dependent hydrolase (beta-lactamase superfamily II)
MRRSNRALSTAAVALALLAGSAPSRYAPLHAAPKPAPTAERPQVGKDTVATPQAQEAADAFCAFIDARDRHDFERANDLRVRGSIWFDAEGDPHPDDEARQKAEFEWESVMGAKWRCRILGDAGGWLGAEASEENRLYDTLGVGVDIQHFRVRAEGGRIRELRAVKERYTGRNYADAIAEFKSWLKQLPKERLSGVLQHDDLILNRESGLKLRALLDEWQETAGRGRRILAKAVDALGGTERLSNLDDWMVEGKGRENLSAELQGLSPEAPTWRPHEEKVAVVRKAGVVAWERRTERNDRSLRWRRFIYKPDVMGVVDWTTNGAQMVPRQTPEPARLALMRRIPHLLLLDAATHATRAVAHGERTIEGSAHDIVETVLPDGSSLTLLFARDPVLLARAEAEAYLPGMGDVIVGWSWHGWKRDAGLRFAPSGHRIDVRGATFQEVEYTRFEAGTPDAAAMMELPVELSHRVRETSAPPPPPAGPATGEVAAGVHVAEIRGFLVMFIAFRDFVVAFDAPAAALGLESIPASGQSSVGLVTKEFLELIARTCPATPVRYVIISHHHGDHVGGVRAFAREGLTILAAPGDVSVVRRALTAPSLLAPQAWKETRGETNVEAVPDRRVISDGTRRLEVVNVGQNPHTTENLFAWLPDQGVLLEGDLFYNEEGAIFPPSGRETMNRFFAQWLTAHGMSPRAIYGVHYRGAAGSQALMRASGL